MGGQLQQRPAKWYCRMQLQDSQREQQVLQQLNCVLCRCCIIRLDDCCGAGRRLADSDLQVAGGAVAPGGNKAEKTTITALLPSHPGNQSLQPAPACLLQSARQAAHLHQHVGAAACRLGMKQEAVGRGAPLTRRGKVGHVSLPDVGGEVLQQL